MKQKVKFSRYSLIVTAAILMFCFVGIILSLHNTVAIITSCVLTVGLISLGGLCPVSVKANDSGITIYRLLSKPKFFAYPDIESVETFYPSGGGIRLCGSDGFFGYWGYFSDIMIGTYSAYYGSRSHCFLVKMKKKGKQYVLGCTDPDAMIGYIRSQMEK